MPQTTFLNAAFAYVAGAAIVAVVAAMLVNFALEIGARSRINRYAMSHWLKNRVGKLHNVLRPGKPENPASAEVLQHIAQDTSDLAPSSFYALHYQQICSLVADRAQADLAGWPDNYREASVVFRLFIREWDANSETPGKMLEEKEVTAAIQRGVDGLQAYLGNQWARITYLLSGVASALVVVAFYNGGLLPTPEQYEVPGMINDLKHACLVTFMSMLLVPLALAAAERWRGATS